MNLKGTGIYLKKPRQSRPAPAKLRWSANSLLGDIHKDRPPGPAPGGRRFDLTKTDLVALSFHHALKPGAEDAKLVAACQYFAYSEGRRTGWQLPPYDASRKDSDQNS